MVDVQRRRKNLTYLRIGGFMKKIMKRIFGYGDGSFKPDAFLTRAETASILNRVFNRVTDAEAIKGFEDKIHKFTDLDKNAWYYYEIVEATNHHESERCNEKDSMNRHHIKWTKVINNK